MTNIKMKPILLDVFLVAALFTLSVQNHGGTVSAKEVATKTCSVAILNGSYGNVFQFLNLPPGSPVPQPIGAGTHFAGAGFTVYTFDGMGNVSGPSRLSFGGLIISSMISGTYTVNADCTGTLSASVVGSTDPPFSLEFVIVDNGNEIHTLGVASGEIAVGTMKKQFP